MDDTKTQIPFRISQLILGFFLHTITKTEQIELDNWIGMSLDNQKLFEQCMEISMRPIQLIAYEESSEDFGYIAHLFIQNIRQTITAEELNTLEKWKKSNNINLSFLKSLEESPNIEILFERLKMHFHNMNAN